MTDFPLVSLILFSIFYESSFELFIFAYAVFVTIASVALTLHDKMASIKGNRRVPEKKFFLLAAIGGALPMYISMLIISHKTRHRRFMIGLPCIIIAQVATLIALNLLL